MLKFTVAAGLLIVGLLMAGGLWLFTKGARNVQRALASRSWPQTAGTVVSSKTIRTATAARRGGSGSVTFSTETVVRYKVEGKEYTTDTVRFGQSLGSDDKSEAALQRFRYPEGQAVVVFYDPRAPWVGVLKPGLHGGAFGLVIASLALLIPAALVLMVGPIIVRDTGSQSQAFEDSVKQAIQDAQRGLKPAFPEGPPKDVAGDRVMMIVTTGFGLVACGVGILALSAGVQRMWRGNASLSWPTTPGVVVMASKGETDQEGTTDDTSDSAWYARFVYRYSVAGVDHFNNLRRFAQVEGGGGAQEVGRLATRYRKGAKVTVSYSPSDPDVAVLEPGNSPDNFWLPGIGVVALSFSALVFLLILPSMARG